MTTPSTGNKAGYTPYYIFQGSATVRGGSAFNYPRMIHQTHMGDQLTNPGYNLNDHCDPVAKTNTAQCFNTVGFPQDVKNCVKCHTGTASAAGSTSGTHVTKDGDNWKNVPSRLACGACHDGINFVNNTGVNLGDAKKGLTVSAIPHIGGSKADDALCLVCHDATSIPVYHNTVYTVPTTDGVTVGAQTAAQKSLPDGTPTLSYSISSVTVSGTPMRANVTFKILMNGTAVKLNAKGSSEMVTGYAKTGPSIYLAYAVPEDGNATPADFNFVNSGTSLANLWANSGTQYGTLTANADGSYTTVLGVATSDGLDIPANAGMVTTMLLGSFKQTVAANTAKYPNGLTIPAVAAMKTATGYTARRTVVALAKCNACHEQLGIDPNFHSGARNDPTICAVCHNPNQGSSGWSADAATFYHGIHAGDKRSVAFTPDSLTPFVFPGKLKNCEGCHLPDTYNFGATASAAAVPNLLFKTVAKGIYNNSASTVTAFATYDLNGVKNNGGDTKLCPPSAATAAMISPYVTADNTSDYGLGFAYVPYRAAKSAVGAVAANCAANPVVNGSIAVPAVVSATAYVQPASGTTLVNSPISSPCFSCHDTDAAKAHMRLNGGSIYATRASVTVGGKVVNGESCLVCHGAGRDFDIKAVHAM